MESFFPGKFIFPQIWVKRAQNGPKINFFDFQKNLKYCTTNPMSDKILVLELWVKILLAKKLQYSLKFNIPRKKRMMKFTFGMQIDIEVILSFWVCVAIHTQNTENKKFIYISLQHLLENMAAKVDFLPVKHYLFRCA